MCADLSSYSKCAYPSQAADIIYPPLYISFVCPDIRIVPIPVKTLTDTSSNPNEYVAESSVT